MQVPERLVTIGGGILITSTLVLGLKAHVSDLLPQVSDSVPSTTDNHTPGSFNTRYQRAQKEGQRTGTWGSSLYYIDDQQDLYVGPGRLQGPLSDRIGSDAIKYLRTLHLEGNVRMPPVSSRLFANASRLERIYGTERLDSSTTTDLFSMFSNDYQLDHLDLSSWDTSQVSNMSATFSADSSLSDLNVHDWHTDNATDMGYMFYGTSLTNVDLSHWNTSHVTRLSNLVSNDSNLKSIDLSHFNTEGLDTSSTMSDAFTDTPLQHITLGDQTTLFTNAHLSEGSWQGPHGQVLSSSGLLDGQVHPGTWTKQ